MKDCLHLTVLVSVIVRSGGGCVLQLSVSRKICSDLLRVNDSLVYVVEAALLCCECGIADLWMYSGHCRLWCTHTWSAVQYSRKWVRPEKRGVTLDKEVQILISIHTDIHFFFFGFMWFVQVPELLHKRKKCQGLLSKIITATYADYTHTCTFTLKSLSLLFLASLSIHGSH